VAGKYRIDGVLGQGGMGTVYAATHLVTDKPVALKLIAKDAHETSRERLLREAKAAGRVDHPNVVDIYDVGEDADGSIFLVMERLQGMPLETAMAPGPMAVAEAIGLLMPVMRGVAAAHAQGVVHRDLKPENIFLVEHQDGSPRTIKVLDFGISKMAGVQIQLTQTGMVLGTPHYMAPEQLKGDKAIDHRCDQYALGCILYEMLEGKPPHDAGSYPELAAMKLEHDPRPFKQAVPRKLQRILLRAMHRRPSKRFGDVRTLALELEPFGAGARFHDTATDWSGAYPRSPSSGQETLSLETPLPRRRRWLIPVALVAALAGAALAGWLWQAEPVAQDDAAPPLAESSDRESAESAHAAATDSDSATDSEDREPSADAEDREPSAETVAEPEADSETEAASEMRAERSTRRRRARRTRREAAEARSGSLSIDDF
jgi:serine/threonine protein kinase